MGKILFGKSDYRYSAAAIASSENRIAAVAVKCSQNIDSGKCWGYSEIVSRVSENGGEDWSEEKVIAIPPARKITAEAENTKSAFFINPVLTTAKNGEFVLVFTFFPESMGNEEEKLLDKKKAAHTYFNGKICPVIYDRDGSFFIIAEDGKVLSSAKAPTEYTVKGLGDLYSGEEYLGNIFLNGAMGKSEEVKETKFGAPLKAPKRSYIMAMKSADGIEWSEPADITPSILNDTDGVCLMTSKGNGVTCESGRIIIPLTSDKGAACIYSDDNGDSWNRNQRMPYLPAKDSVSIMQATGGELIAVGKKACISYDNGITWIKDKTKFTPSKAIAKGDKAVTVIDSKDGTVIIGGEFCYKKSKYKGIAYSKDSSALAGGLLPSTDLAVAGSTTVALYVTPDNQQVSFDTLSI